MAKPAASDFRNGVACRRRALFCLLLTLSAVAAWPKELAKEELRTTAGRAFSFQDFRGPPSVTQSASEIVGIGKVLGRSLRASSTRGSYFGKYEAIRAFDPSQTRLLGADIIIFNAGARVDSIENVRRVVAGYLEAAFGLGQTEAAPLAVLLLKYNAAHRGDIAYLSQKFSPDVMLNLTVGNAGIALSYAEWPGKTRLLIPLGHAANGQPSVGVTPGQAGETATPGQSGGAATSGRSSGTRTTGPALKGARATGGTGPAGTMGGTGVTRGTTSGGAGAARTRVGGSFPVASRLFPDGRT